MPKSSRPPLSYRTAEIRAASLAADAPDTFAGHAAHFWSVDAYGTAIKRGAFRKTLKERGDRVPLLWQHDPFAPIGRPTELAEDRDGLAFRAEVVTDTRAGAEALALLRADVPLGMSFGFETVRSRPIEDDDADKLDWSQAPDAFATKDGRQFVRLIEEVRLWEISLVTFPANEGATVDDVRADAPVLSSLLDAIEAGALDDERRGLVQRIVAAWGEKGASGPGAAPPGIVPARTPVEARPVGAHEWASFDLAAALSLERFRLTLTGVNA